MSNIKHTCDCSERGVHIVDRKWVITKYQPYIPSFLNPKPGFSFAEVMCLSCGSETRTKAKYIKHLKHLDIDKATKLKELIENNTQTLAELTINDLLWKELRIRLTSA